MSLPFVDTDVIIRLLTGDDPTKQAAAKALFEQVEQGTLTVAAPVTVIADAVYVLSSARLYHLPRTQVSALLSALVSLPHFRIRNRRAVLRALELYAPTNLDFGDVFIAASMEQLGAHVLYSYDKGFDRLSGIQRQQP
ncbi:MAG TPA: PIN domain-containing protein [Ktedonobacterales bacterium]